MAPPTPPPGTPPGRKPSRSHRLAAPAVLAGPLAALLAAASALSAPLAAQEAESAGPPAALAGTVTDAATGEPLAGAVVAVPSLGVGTVSDGDGSYALDGLPAGELEVEVRLRGGTTVARSVSLRAGAVNRVDMVVRTGAVEVPGLEVTVRRPIPRGKMAGFHLRREEGQGVLLDREEIQATSPSRMSDVFRRIPGVRLIRPPRRTDVRFRLRMARAQPTFTGDGAECRPKYFVDGRPFVVGDEQGVNEIFDPDELAGIEVYRGVSEIPARFNGPGARCGVVVFWTRDPGTEARSSGDR